MQKIFGLDFSGAKQAGKKIWISEGLVHENKLEIIRCYRGDSLPNADKNRDKVLPALVSHIKNNEGIWGLDFSFSIPKELIYEETWEEFIENFVEKYDDPDKFRDDCREKNPRELKRDTDKVARVPYATYNARMYRQTFYGISKVLYPLLKDGNVSFLPMQKPRAGTLSVIEICPASTLKNEDLYPSYKGKDEKHKLARIEILSELKKRAPLTILDSRIEDIVIEDPEGDALDSIVASYTIYKVLNRMNDSSIPSSAKIEGYIYMPEISHEIDDTPVQKRLF